ncbi:MAG: hypothetical protein AAFO89_14620, partial [Planctomycetota bacterium]
MTGQSMHAILASLPIVGLVPAMTVRASRLGLPLAARIELPGVAVVALLLQAVPGHDAGGTLFRL